MIDGDRGRLCWRTSVGLPPCRFKGCVDMIRVPVVDCGGEAGLSAAACFEAVCGYLKVDSPKKWPDDLGRAFAAAGVRYTSGTFDVPLLGTFTGRGMPVVLRLKDSHHVVARGTDGYGTVYVMDPLAVGGDAKIRRDDLAALWDGYGVAVWR